MTQLHELSRPFSGQYVKKAPKGKFGDYVPHHVINQRALSIVGPHSFGVSDVIRGLAHAIGGKVDGKFVDDKWPARDGAVVGCLATLTVTVDGTEVTITEVGTEDQPAMHTDAENLKTAASDAYKRCWMRLGLGLHLWAQGDYFLEAQLTKASARPQTGYAPAPKGNVSIDEDAEEDPGKGDTPQATPAEDKPPDFNQEAWTAIYHLSADKDDEASAMWAAALDKAGIKTVKTAENRDAVKAAAESLSEES